MILPRVVGCLADSTTAIGSSAIGTSAIGPSAIGLLAAIASAVCFGAAAVLQAVVVRDLGPRADSLLWMAVQMWIRPRLLGVVLAYLVGFALHAVAIWLLPLYLAQAAISLSLPITAWWAARKLGEPMGRVAWVSVAAIVAGLGLLAFGAGDAGLQGIGAPFAAVLWLLVIVLALFSLLGRLEDGVEFGALAGLGYAGTAIGVRGATGAESAVWTAVASGLAVPALGMLAFWLYSMAMDRGQVAVASALVIVSQTLLPTIVGLALLGDQIAAGREWAIVTGLVAAMGGAIVLSRQESRSAQVTG
mgnify:CR=1 FL=1